jgi:hypothetical protein
MWWLLFIPLISFAGLDDYVQKKPNADVGFGLSNGGTLKNNRNFLNPNPDVSMAEIIASGLEPGILKEGKSVIRVEDGKKIALPREISVHFYRLPDATGFKYLAVEGKPLFKIYYKDITTVKEDIVMYEPPHRYTPAKPHFVKHYDRKIMLFPEAVLYLGVVQGKYMERLFSNDVRTGTSQQVGVHAYTKWTHKWKLGVAGHYESTQYNLSQLGSLKYSSFSFGPQVKTPDFNWGETPLRVQAQLRYGPFARARAERVSGKDFAFHSTDFLVSLEHPMKNKMGAFVIGLFYQAQWLSLSKQPAGTDVTDTNTTNNSFGFSLAQVFE